MLSTLIVIAKEPIAERVKTRLAPSLSYRQAAEAAAAALSDTLRIAGSVPADNHVLAFDGCADKWLPDGWSLVRQPSGGLDQRLIAAFAAAGPGPALLIGMDTPQVSLAQLTDFDASRFDACLGRAADGGYWAIGFCNPARDAHLIGGVPMSTARTGFAQLKALHEGGLQVQLLDELVDVDTYADAWLVAGRHPQTEFARTFQSFTTERVG